MKTNLLTAALVSVFLLADMAFTSDVKADPLDKSSPKIAHGMYRDRGKSSPKIAHGMYREIDKSSPKIAHGMYREIDKSSPKIAHGMYRDRGKSSPKIAETVSGMYWDRGKSSPKIAHEIRVSPGSGRAHVYRLMDMVEMALEIGDVELADELVDEVLALEYGFFGR